MKYIIALSLCFFLLSCRIHDRSLLREIIDDKDSTILYHDKLIGRTSSVDRTGNYVLSKVPAILNYDKNDKQYYISLKNSNYAVKDFKFKAEELKLAKVYVDSMYDRNDKFEYIETVITISCKSRNKLVGIVWKNNDFIIKMYESVTGSEVKMHQLFNVMEFDENGLLKEKRQEYLY